MTKLEIDYSVYEKACNGCGVTKKGLEFHKQKHKGDGLQSKCKECLNAYAKAYREAYPEKCRAATKASREANPEKYKTAQRKRREAGGAELLAKERAYHKAYREANPEKIKQYGRTNRERNAPKRRAKNIAKYSRVRGLGLEIMEQVRGMDEFDRMLFAQKITLMACYHPEYRKIHYMTEINDFIADYHPDEEAYLRDTLGRVEY